MLDYQDSTLRLTGPTFLLAPPLMALALLSPLGISAKPSINDTGMEYCINGSKMTYECTGTGQDAEFGRDVRFPRDGNGLLGFNFVKISETGAELPSEAADWKCVLDRVSGLMWEVKSLDPNDQLHSYYKSYNYVGAQRLATKVNEAGFCGHNDWRIPSRWDLHNLSSYQTSEAVLGFEKKWFLNQGNGIYWTSNVYANKPSLGYWTYSANTKYVYFTNPEEFRQVMLVRNSRADIETRWVFNGDEVTDRRTGLIWMRCAAGQQWNGSTCVGNVSFATWDQALEFARLKSIAYGLAWRVPNVKELSSILNLEAKPAYFQDVFPRTLFSSEKRASFYWSSTPQTFEAFIGLSFDTGWMSVAFSQYWSTASVRLVRDAD